MDADGLVADEEPGSDLVIRLTRDEVGEDLAFRTRQARARQSEDLWRCLGAADRGVCDMQVRLGS